jgi:hypothetical protein
VFATITVTVASGVAVAVAANLVAQLRALRMPRTVPIVRPLSPSRRVLVRARYVEALWMNLRDLTGPGSSRQALRTDT